MKKLIKRFWFKLREKYRVIKHRTAIRRGEFGWLMRVLYKKNRKKQRKEALDHWLECYKEINKLRCCDFISAKDVFGGSVLLFNDKMKILNYGEL